MDRMPTTPDSHRERLEQLKALMPDLFTNDGTLDPDELKRLVDPATVAESERFEFRWFGKANAKQHKYYGAYFSAMPKQQHKNLQNCSMGERCSTTRNIMMTFARLLST